jgi:hypothetical protein
MAYTLLNALLADVVANFSWQKPFGWAQISELYFIFYAFVLSVVFRHAEQLVVICLYSSECWRVEQRM